MLFGAISPKTTFLRSVADFLNELLTVRALTHGEEMLLSVVVKTSLEQKRAVAKSEL